MSKADVDLRRIGSIDVLKHPICLRMPERLTPVTAWLEHIPFAMFLVDILRPRVIVELGAHAGDSYCSFCQAVVELDYPARCYAIDSWTGDAHAGFYGTSVLDDLRAHHDPRFSSFSTLIQSTFDDALQYFEDGTIDLLHIDGFHTYEAAKHDFESWFSKLSPNAVVLFHDINVHERDFGIYRLWSEVKSRYPHFEFLHGHGLGILAVGEVKSPEFQALLNSDDESLIVIREFFFQLGHRLTFKRNGDLKESLVKELQQRIAEMQSGIGSLTNLTVGPRIYGKADGELPSVSELQVFWSQGDGFSEENSAKQLSRTDGELYEYCFQIPPVNVEVFRIDPTNREGVVEIVEIVLLKPNAEGHEEVVSIWTAANNFAGLEAVSGVVSIEMENSLGLICLDDDPQLMLGGFSPPEATTSLILKVSLRSSENPYRTVSAGIQYLEHLVAELRQSQKDEAENWRQLLNAKDLECGRLQTDILKRDERADELQRRLEDQDERYREAINGYLSERESLVSRLGDKEKFIYDVTNSRGWKVLSKYWQVKSRLVRPILNWSASRHPDYSTVSEAIRSNGRRGYSLVRKDRLRDFVEVVRRKTFRPQLVPTHEIVSDGAQWGSTGTDPQFSVAGPWPNGWTKVCIHIQTEGTVRGSARLYIDNGAGFSEAESYDLGQLNERRVTYLPLSPKVVQMRLDPFESKGRFEVKEFSLQRVTRRKGISKALKRANSKPGLAEFVQFSRARLRHFRGEHGRLPRPSEILSAVGRSLVAWRNGKEDSIANRVIDNLASRLVPEPRLALDPYDAWLEVNQWNSRREGLLRAKLSTLEPTSLLSIVMPVFDPPIDLLDKAIRCVVDQIYQNWELCIADDASADPSVRSLLKDWSERDQRIKILFREENGNISRATNTAAELAEGEFIVLMDHDDEIPTYALAEVALYLAEHPDTDVLYSDDDKIDLTGRRFAPQFKPDWSPELLLSYMYFSHLFVLKRSLFLDVGGMREGFEGSQDYDLALRATERANKIGHIPKVLYHWRVVPGSTATSGGAKPNSFRAGIRAVQEAFDRRGITARVAQPDWAAAAQCGIFSHDFPDTGPSVAIIIPTKNNLEVLKVCIDSLEKTTYKNYQVVVIDNGSDDPKTLNYLEQLPHRVLRILNPNGKFNFAAINNRAAEQLDADYVLFLNNDTEVIAPKWLSQMVGYLGLEGVGAVGARLLYPDNRIQHAGIVHGYYNGMAGPAFKLLASSDSGYLSYARVVRNYLAVTAACLLTPRDLFLSLGGFDEEEFSVAYNDVDYCYRLNEAGYRNVYCATAELYHHESYSRGFVDNPAEPAAFRNKYGNWTDPFYNPNLSVEHEQFAIESKIVASDILPPIPTLMCAFNLNWEGAPYSQFELTAKLKKNGIINPIVYSPTDGPLRRAYEENGIQVEVFDHPLAGVFNEAAYQRAITEFCKKIKEWNVELVYGNTLETFYTIDAAHKLTLPSIWNPRESEPWQTYFDFLGPEIAPHALNCFNYPYKVVFVSNATRKAFSALDTHNSFITIHNGIDRERFRSELNKWTRDAARKALQIEQGEIAVLLMGTVCERKGQADLVEALSRLSAQQISSLKILIVGDRDSEYSRKLHALRQSLPALHQSHLSILPETADIALYFSAADIFVCTSRVESYPRVILEAMLADLPIITTPVFGIIEQVQKNVNALFYQPCDIGALADAIIELAFNDELRREFAANSKHVLNTLTDYDTMASCYGRVFREAWLSGRTR